MLIEAVEPNTVVETDLCIVGGGAVGLLIAHELEGSGLRVTLLEGGGREFDEASQNLYVGAATGTILPKRSAYLVTSRLRYLGGGTNHWQGWCRPLDPIDFEERSWVPGSGWPMPFDSLTPYYDRAAEFVQVDSFAADRPTEPAEPAKRGPRPVFPPKTGIETIPFHISELKRFGDRYGPELEASDSCRLHLNANVVELVTDESGGRVEHVVVVGADGERYRVSARAFVIAAGGIENARLLLVSNRHQSGGLGNGHDQVGRYFLDHPFFDAAFAVFPRRRNRMRHYFASRETGSGFRTRSVLRLADRVQREERILNSLMVLEAVAASEASEVDRAVGWVAEDIARLVRGRDVKQERAPGLYAFVRIACEQVPDAESRVSLVDELDALGMPRVRLEWRLGDQDAESVHRTITLLAHRLGSTFRGRTRLLADPSQQSPWPWSNAGGSAHHMGTTRMHPDPRQGVVDADCRVHGVGNLYVAGSSVFPTAGSANPTLTLLALGVRLSDHLRERVFT